MANVCATQCLQYLVWHANRLDIVYYSCAATEPSFIRQYQQFIRETGCSVFGYIVYCLSFLLLLHDTSQSDICVQAAHFDPLQLPRHIIHQSPILFCVFKVPSVVLWVPETELYSDTIHKLFQCISHPVPYSFCHLSFALSINSALVILCHHLSSCTVKGTVLANECLLLVINFVVILHTCDPPTQTAVLTQARLTYSTLYLPLPTQFSQ